MATKFHHRHRNDVASVVLNHHHHNNHHFRLCNSFSATALRRKLIATVSCGGYSSCKKPDPKPTTTTNNPSRIRVGSEKLSDLLNLSDSSSSWSLNTDTTSTAPAPAADEKEERVEELKAAVRMMHSDGVVERENGAKIVRRLTKEDGEARSILGMLGAIPTLVGILGDHDIGVQVEALYGLLNLGIGNEKNKAAIVKAGAVHKMLKKLESSNEPLQPSISEAVVANFLSLSALDSNKSIIGASGAISFLVSVLEDSDKKYSWQARQDSLRALYNLSISPSNIPFILETNLVRFLVNTLGDMEISERILSILSNVVSTPEGRRAISKVPDVFPILIDVLNWTDSPGCQEKSSYILMVMAHKSYNDRQTMIEAGIGSALLELTLLGSALAQKRASRILDFLRVDKGKQVSEISNGDATSPVSAPICASSSSTSNSSKEEEAMISEEKKAVKQLVQQSLQNNLRRIVKRANLPQDFTPSDHLKSLTVSSTSKSLPF